MGGCLSFRYRRLSAEDNKKLVEDTQRQVEGRMKALTNQEQEFERQIEMLSQTRLGIIRNKHNLGPARAKDKALAVTRRMNNVMRQLSRLRQRIDYEHNQALEIMQMASNNEMLIHNQAIVKNLQKIGFSESEIKKQMTDIQQVNDRISDFNAGMNNHIEDASSGFDTNYNMPTEEEMMEELDELFTEDTHAQLQALPDITPKRSIGPSQLGLRAAVGAAATVAF